MGIASSTQNKSTESNSPGDIIEKPDENLSKIPYLMVTCKSWNKNSFGLYDYESKDIQKKSLKVVGTNKLLRLEHARDQIEIESSPEQLSVKDTISNLIQKESQLARVYYTNGGYWIYHKNQVDLSQMYSNPEEKLWYVVRYNQGNKGFKLERNSIVKFGRVRLRVRDIDYENPNLQQNQTQNAQSIARASLTQRKMTQDEIGASLEVNDIELQEKSQQHQPFERDENNILNQKEGKKDTSVVNLTGSTNQVCCRICWGTEEELEGKDFNPLISPCNCTGTMKAIHLKCLKQWLDSKRSMKVHRGQVIIKFKKLDCELCKLMFPFQLAHNNRIVDIVEIEKPESDFIIFESLSAGPAKVFYIINTENKQQIRIGRGQESDIRITDDISVSRCHAIIKKNGKGEYILEDFNSKFGTLVQVQYPLFINPHEYRSQPLVFQQGKSCLFINVKQQTFCLPACFRPVQKQEHDSLATLDQQHYFPREFLQLSETLKSKKQQKTQQALVMRVDEMSEEVEERKANPNIQSDNLEENQEHSDSDENQDGNVNEIVGAPAEDLQSSNRNQRNAHNSISANDRQLQLNVHEVNPALNPRSQTVLNQRIETNQITEGLRLRPPAIREVEQVSGDMIQVEEEKHDIFQSTTKNRQIVELVDVNSNPNTQRYHSRETRIKKSKDFAGAISQQQIMEQI